MAPSAKVIPALRTMRNPRTRPPRQAISRPSLKELRERVRGVLGVYHRRLLNTRDHNPWEVMHCDHRLRRRFGVAPGRPEGRKGQLHRLALLQRRLPRRAIVADRSRPHLRPQGPFGAGALRPVPGDSRPIARQDRLPAVGRRQELHHCRRDRKREVGLPAGHGADLQAPLAGPLPGLGHDLEEPGRRGMVDREAGARGACRADPRRGLRRHASLDGPGLCRQQAAASRANPSAANTCEPRRSSTTTIVTRFRCRTPTAASAPSGSIAAAIGPTWTGGCKPPVTSWNGWRTRSRKESLTDPRIVKAVGYLTGILQNGEDRGWEIGPLGHGVHALAIYDSRVFKPHDTAATAQTLARRELVTAPSLAARSSSQPATPAPRRPRSARRKTGSRDATKPRRAARKGQPTRDGPNCSRLLVARPRTAVRRFIGSPRACASCTLAHSPARSAC